MKKYLKTALIIIAAAALLYLIYRLAFIRTVDYEIAGIKIPSQYNLLTDKITPITNYKGKSGLKTVSTLKTNKLGLSEEQVVIAKLRWAIFEQWANSHSEYKGWQNDQVIFKKANDDFKKQIKDRR